MNEPRPPVFVSAEIRVRALPSAGEPCAQLSIAGVTITISMHEGRALCTALRDVFDQGPMLPGVER